MTAPPAGAADPCTAPVSNEVACENTKPGTPESEWRVSGTGDPSIQGFTTAISVNRGQTVFFKIKTPAASYHIDILRLGYYGGLGARRVASGIRPSASLPQSQPACLTQNGTGLIDCGNWAVSASWAVPVTAVSGVYIARMVRDDTQGATLIPFVVRNDASTDDVALQTNDTSWVAYNDYGGNSLYKCTTSACPTSNPQAYKNAYKVSYNRPLTTAGIEGPVFWHNEYAMVRFLERNGYDLTYITGWDVHRRGSLLLNHRLFVSSGHDEYWSATQRSNVETARDAGVNLAFFSGNEVFWKTRWEPSIDASGTADRTIVGYKDTHLDAPTDPVEWTGTWRDRRFVESEADPQEPENSLTGQFFVVNQGTTAITVPSQYSKLRFWRNTAVASLSAGQSVTLAPQSLGYEWDEAADNGFRPHGLFHLSSTTATVPQVFNDYGTDIEPGTATHHLTLYRAPSGALVFGAGTVQWSWGLDNWYVRHQPVDRNMQQATVNLFADMGAQPATLQPDLVATAASADATAPVSTIGSPTGGTVADGAKVTVSGSASDVGGVVAGVEVSTDGGSTWHPASGTTSWSYTWTAHGAPRTTIKARAVDDSGNVETPGAGVSVNVSCPCSLWGSTVPEIVDSGDANGIEVGVKFQTDTPGEVAGIRFYKSTANTGTHVGSLWTASGQRLAQATFTNESGSGWQTVTFAQPVTIAADTTYVASYHAPNGHYASTRGAFYAQPAPPRGGGSPESPPLRVLRNTASTGNGVFTYSSSSTFPTSSFKAANYWVDVVFVAGTGAPPAQVTGVTATAGEVSADVSWSAPADGGSQITSYTITPYDGTSAQTPTTVTGSPAPTSAKVRGLTAGVAYRFTVKATNLYGSGPASAQSNAVIPLPSTASPPGAPTGVTATAATGSASVRWTAPASDGGSTVSSYVVTPYAGSTAQPSKTLTGYPPETSTTITGLKDGTEYTFRVTAANDAGSGPSSAASNPVMPQNTLFDATTPTVLDSGDGGAVELGVKFTADVAGSVRGIRFYKSAANTGTHVGSLWTAGGQRLAQATFTNETASGWQTVTFAQPVTVAAGTTYIASYHAPNGHYSVTGSGFSLAVANGALRALANSSSLNGVFAYGATSSFPSSSYNASNYWVDLLFVPGSAPPATAPEAPTGVTATAGDGSAMVSWTAPSDGGSSIVSYTVTPYVGSTAQTPTTVTGSPPATGTTITGLTNGTTYTFRVTATNSIGTSPASAASNGVTPAAVVTAPAAPTGVSATAGDGSATVSWTAPPNGGSAITSYTVTPYVGSTAQTPKTVTGSPPGTTTTITGLTNGTSYTFRVTATNGVGTSPPSAASNAVTPGRVDPPGAPTGVTARAATGSASVSWTAPSTDGGSAITGYVVTPYAGSTPQTAKTVGATTSTTVTGLTDGTTYTFRVAAVNAAGAGAQSAASDPVTPLNTLFDDAVPAVAAANDSGAVELGVKFTADVAGTVRGIRFYKSATNTGTHTGSLWSATGQRLAQATFTGETASGWQTATFTQPVQIAANTTYVASYHAPNGQYAATGSGFSLAVANGALRAPANSTSPNGVYAYGATSSFPANSFNATNYWVDPVFAPGAGPAPTAPAAPTGVTATAGDGSALLSWTAPGDGGSAITSYTVTPYVGSTAQTPKTVTGSPPATGTTITGLTNGTAYTFRVTATNAVGEGPASAPSNSVTPTAATTAPAAPTGVSATAGDGSATVSWTAPSDGGSPITGYTVTPYAGSTAQTPKTITGSPPGTTTTITGLTNGTAYTFRVTATNAVGEGPASAPSDPVTPVRIDPPGAPTGVTARAATGSASVSWTAPSSDGGSAITGYVVTPYAGSTAQAPKTVGATTSTTVSGLTDGTTYTFRVAAVNAAGTGAQSAASDPVTPLNTLFDDTAPALPDAGDAAAVELGVKFTADVAGTVRGIRFYKSAANTGTHTGSLWSATGQRLAQATFAGESASGWQTATFSQPVQIAANTTYVASYHAPEGHYAATGSGFSLALANGALRALANATSPNGVFAYGAAGSFPTNSFNATNYWVDPVFVPGSGPAPTAPAAPTGVSATAGDGTALVSWTAPGDGGSAIVGYTVTPYVGSTAQAPRTVTGSPPATGTTITGLTNGTTYTFRVTATNAVGEGPASAASNAVTPAPAATAPSAPTGVSAATGDGSATVSWTAPSDGGSPITAYTVTPYVGSTAQTPKTVTGSPPATGTTITGLTNGTTYTFRVTATNAVGEGPASAASNAVTPTAAPTAPAAPTGVSATAGDGSATVSWTAPSDGGSAITSYTVTPYAGSTPQAPKTVSGSPPATGTTITGLTNGTAYTFRVTATNAVGEGPASAASNSVTPRSIDPPGAPTAVTARPATGSATVSWTAPASDGGSAITGYVVTPYDGSTAQAPKTVGATTSTTVSGLTDGTAYTFRVAAVNAAGTGAQSAASDPVTPLNTLFDDTAPAVPDANDPGAVELGVKFTADVAGRVHGIRFYKSAANTGTHTGSLWSTSGERLAQATFAGESASGWQTATFTQPVPIAAGTTYIASYHAPNGHYAATSAGFASAVANGALRALANPISPNGVFAYGATSSFPTGSYNATNYWVDPLFAPGSGPAPAPTAPAAPTGVTATAGDGSATVSWTAPDDGGSSIVSYTVTPYVGSTPQTPKTITGSPPATTTTITGLTNGTAYTFRVAATNSAGTGPASSASSAVTPTAPATVPAAPSQVAATAGNKSATVSWAAPSSDGGSPITAYIVTPYVGTSARTPKTITGSPPATTTTITGLSNGTTYTFRVAARNSIGTSAQSAASNPVTPRLLK